MRSAVRNLVILTAIALMAASPVTAVSIDDGEARAALTILRELQKGTQPSTTEWSALYASAGYRRLQQREADFKRPFTDRDFAAFLTSAATVAQTDALQRTLDGWTSKNLDEMEGRARAYLPANSALRATVYILIKPKTNSFVYQLDTNPDVHPHWEDSPKERAVWDAAMARYDSDFADLERFFGSIAGGSLKGDAIAAKGMTYFGTDQGPWYTVGYKMDVTIERQMGRAALVSALCDKRSYLATYNAAAQAANRTGANLPLWPAGLASFLR